MKNQALFSSKDLSKKLKCRLLQFLFGALRVKRKPNFSFKNCPPLIRETKMKLAELLPLIEYPCTLMVDFFPYFRFLDSFLSQQIRDLS